MAEAKLKESTLVMRVAATDYSEKYEAGQVMSQTITEGTVVNKWSTVNVTVSKGSDKVNLRALNILGMTAEKAQAILEEKGLTVEKKTENSDNVVKGNVIRYSPECKPGSPHSLWGSSKPFRPDSNCGRCAFGGSRTCNRHCGF